MNLKKRLEHIAGALDFNRRYGKTSLIAKACRDLNGIMLAATFDQAKNIARSHDVEAKSIEMNLDGYRGPFFIDHHAASVLLQKAANKISELEREIDELKSEGMVKSLEEEVAMLKFENERLEIELLTGDFK
jgi:hypothetical protein